MYLSKLEIVGFKSFAQKTKFVFQGGLSGIVGPNGCGKSNVVDAIRWVLGEQKTSVLRSDQMDNVIFNGSGNRKPLSMAEVTMSIENSRNILPTEYDEVNITRRLFRNGDSQYLLNKTKCRLKDIIELFMDTGLGPDSYSVIELKMVEAILSGKVDDRRRMLEEAAGVNKYKIRRREAERKLNAVETDLTRVEDIVMEVKKNVNSLSRQAAKTRRFNNLQIELRQIETELLKHELLKYQGEHGQLLEVINKFSSDIEILDKKVNKTEASLDEMRAKRSDLESKNYKINEDFSALLNNIASKNKDLAVSTERIGSIRKNADRLDEELNNTDRMRDKAKKNLEQLEQQIEEKTEFRENAQENLETQKEISQEAQRMVNNLREEANQSNRQVLNSENQINTLNNDRRRNLSQKDNLENRIKQSDFEIEKLNKQKSELESELNSRQSRSYELETELENAEQELIKAQEHKQSLQNTLNEMQVTIGNLKNQLGQKHSMKNFLDSLVDTAESSKFLLNSKDWQPEAGKQLLPELIGADDKFLLAIDSALRDYSHCFVVNSRVEAQDAIDALANSKKGKAAFISRENVPEIDAPEECHQEEGIYGWLSELARVDDTLRYALRGIFGRTAIVEDISMAYRAIDFGWADAAVTLNGKYVGRSGLLVGGTVKSQDAITVGKKERVEKIHAEIEELEEQISIASENYQETKDEFDSIDLRELERIKRKVEQENNTNNNRIEQIEYKIESLEANTERFESTKADISKEIENVLEEDEKIKAKLEEAEELFTKMKEKNQDFISQLEGAEENHARLMETTRSAEMEFIKSNEELKNLEREIQQTKDRIRGLERNQQSREEEIERNKHTVEKLDVEIDKIHEELQTLKVREDDLKNKREYISQELTKLRHQIEELSKELKNDIAALNIVKDKKHSKDMDLGELNANIKNLHEKSQEKYGEDINIEGFEASEEFDIKESREHVFEISEKLRKIGPVNHRALDDFEKESERLRFYEKQVNDLYESQKNLSSTIKEINNTAERKFKETFDRIKANFKMLFSKLFGEGGSCDLTLAEGNPLDANIEIMAQPPGKRPHSIEGISSGEKTLTAIALLFAIYLVKPSPFCILDEVDAPLDDHNLGRFIDLIKEFSNETQFLIVTHNKKTMEAADTLYGVTMQENGVSKVVSVKLDSKEQ